MEVNMNITKEFLEREYIENRKPFKQIAEEAGCGETKIWNLSKKFQIQPRSRGELLKGREFSISHREALSKSHIASDKRRGDNNPNWRGGVSAQNFLERYKTKYITWRRMVLRHKGNICSACGKNLNERCPCCGRATDKHVHHIQEFAENPDFRYSLDNAVVLCESCHRANHKKQGLNH
jgi:5-methylcytosine-specific restriction endonuclease McrA